MKGAGKTLIKSLYPKLFPSRNSSTAISGSRVSRESTTTTTNLTSSSTSTTVTKEENRATKPYSRRDSAILEKFRSRQFKGSLSDSTKNSDEGAGRVDSGANPTKVVSCFEELGLTAEMIEASEEMGVVVPSEIQCVGVPAILSGKSVVLSGPVGSGRTLSYILPLIQRLRGDSQDFGIKHKQPRAIVLCSSEEECEQVFSLAKFISSHAQTKFAAREDNDSDSGLANAPIGMLVGTPEEILRQIEDKDVETINIRYLVLDEADIMLESESFPRIRKIGSFLKNHVEESSSRSFQSVIICSAIGKMLGEHLVEHLEHKQAGKVAAVIMEIESTEIFRLLESPNALKKKVAEAVESLMSSSSSGS